MKRFFGKRLVFIPYLLLLGIYSFSPKNYATGDGALKQFRKKCERHHNEKIKPVVKSKLTPCGPTPEEAEDRYRGPLYESTATEKIALWKEVEKLPTDANERGINSWQFIGPDKVASYSGSNGIVTGRINAMNYIKTTDPQNAGLIIGSASGGVWMLKNNGGEWKPVSLHGNLNTLNVGYIVQHPVNENEYLLGTGEEAGGSGTGMYKTTDNGNTWTPVNWLGNIPSYFTKIEYDPGHPDTVHAASNVGYYRSVDGGNTWTPQLLGVITDLAVNPFIPYHILFYEANTGLWESSNYGTTFSMVSGVPFNPSNTTNVKMAFAPSGIGRLYASVANPTQSTLGIFKSNNAGASWSQCPLYPLDNNGNYYNFHWNQGVYNNCITVSPVNENFVLAGGGALMKSTDGTNFNVILFTAGYHADVHAIVFTPGADSIFIATDGGIYHSTDGATTFNPDYNRVPVTQFYRIDVAGNNIHHIIGSSQDNSTIISTVSGGQLIWSERRGSDGWNSARSDAQPNDAVEVSGFPPDTSPVSFTSDAGNTWSTYPDPSSCINKGKYVAWERSNNQQWPYIDAALVACGDGVYFRNILNTLIKINTTPFPGDAVGVAVSNRNSAADNSNIYVPILGSTTKIIKRDRNSGNFIDISAGLIQSQQEWYRVYTHAYNFDEVYAAAATTNGKVFRSTNAGTTWVDVSGNLPTIPISSMSGHPFNPNILLVGSYEYGVFRTDDGGQNWYRWENGLPKGTNVTYIEFIDSSQINGKTYAVIGTYGRGVWQRDISGSDPSEIVNTMPASEKLLKSLYVQDKVLYINWNNMLSCNIKYVIADVNGKIVLDNVMPGEQAIQTTHSLTNLSAGMYILNVQAAERGSESYKFVIEK